MRPLIAAAVCLVVGHPLSGQPTMPAWLVNYPGVTPETTSLAALAEITYVAKAVPDVVADHYRKLFEARNLPFQPNSDGMGITVRGAAAECDLLLVIRARDAGTFVRVSCAAKSQPVATSTTTSTQVITSSTSNLKRPVAVRTSSAAGARPPVPQPDPAAVADIMARHNQRAAELRIHPVYHDAPAPPLVWPAWLIHINRETPDFSESVDAANNRSLTSQYVSGEPMTRLYAFYKDLLTSHGYPVHSGEMGTGHTMSGIQQNAYGHLEGSNYPDGSPGPYTVIHVSLSRQYLNEPITVILKFATHAFKAPKP